MRLTRRKWFGTLAAAFGVLGLPKTTTSGAVQGSEWLEFRARDWDGHWNTIKQTDRISVWLEMLKGSREIFQDPNGQIFFQVYDNRGYLTSAWRVLLIHPEELKVRAISWNLPVRVVTPKDLEGVLS